MTRDLSRTGPQILHWKDVRLKSVISFPLVGWECGRSENDQWCFYKVCPSLRINVTKNKVMLRLGLVHWEIVCKIKIQGERMHQGQKFK